MGLDANYPAVRINDPAAVVPVWNGSHTIIGSLGPDDHFHSAAANITCTLQRWNGLWYKLLSNDWDIPSPTAYVSTALTHLMYPGPRGYILGPCDNNHDQPGRRPWWWALLMLAALLGVLFVALRRFAHVRRVSVPPVPPGTPGRDRPGVEDPRPTE